MAVQTEAGPLAVHDKWTGEAIGSVARATPDAIATAVREAQDSLATEWPPAARAEALRAARDRLDARREDLLTTMAAETGFTARDVADEYARACVTLTLCAEEATRIAGERIPLDASAGFESRVAFTLRVPRGVVLAITPFNTPLNGVLHKIGPALAAGNAVVLKPAELTPLTAQAVAEALYDAGVPRARLHVLNGTGEAVGLPLLRDPRVAFTTFTGSTAVGAIVKRETGVRPVALELGSIAVTLVCADGDLEAAAAQIARGGYRKAGQVCTSVQRVLVEHAVHDRFVELLAVHVSALRPVTPRAVGADLGPVISEAAARRVERLIADSAAAGADVVIGGGRDGSLVEPTLITSVGDDAPLATSEAFGPVVAVSAVQDVDEAIARANAGRFGLQAGVFTSSIATALRCARSLQAGGVIVNGTSSTRADGMPFGGQKDSGFGKEGPRYAIRDMTVERVVVLAG